MYSDGVMIFMWTSGPLWIYAATNFKIFKGKLSTLLTMDDFLKNYEISPLSTFRLNWTEVFCIFNSWFHEIFRTKKNNIFSKKKFPIILLNV